jgi:sarcosine oxidase, subunit gamma
MNVILTPTRLSPIHDELEHLHARFVDVAGMPAAVAFGDVGKEKTIAADLGLCDVSWLQRTTLKGPAAASVLATQQIAAPEKVLDVTHLDGGGLIARTGGSEFFIEDGLRGNIVERLLAATRETPSGCYTATRQDASFLLSGKRAAEVFLETCGYDFRTPPKQIVFTRVAGVSCSILHRNFNGSGVFQLWLDGSYGGYLWETLLEIVGELKGAAIGAAAFYHDLAGQS